MMRQKSLPVLAACVIVCGFSILCAAVDPMHVQAADAVTSATQTWLTGKWSTYAAGEGIMPNDQVKAALIEKLGGKKLNKLMILATSSQSNVPITTIAEFALDPDTMTLYGAHEKNTEKLLHMQGNPNVGMSDQGLYGGFTSMSGLQLRCTAELIDGTNPDFDRILIDVIPYEAYQDMLGGMPLDLVRNLLKSMMVLTKITINEAIVTDSKFKESKFRSYQRWTRGVTLSLFTAKSGSRKVELNWVTGAEAETNGFNIYRSEAGGAAAKINAEFIPATGSSEAGASYTYTDEDVQNRKTYTYLLESVDSNGVGTKLGLVSATPKLIYMFE